MPPVPYGELDARLPIVMLPVRLETRYFDIDPATVELRVRIFPSVAHVTTTRSGIDPAERDEMIALRLTDLLQQVGEITGAEPAQLALRRDVPDLDRVVSPGRNAVAGIRRDGQAFDPV